MSTTIYQDELDKIDLEIKENLKRQTKEWRKEFPRRTRLSAIRAKCVAKNLPFNLEEVDIEVPEVCPVFGTKFTETGDTSPHVDRKIPALGYTKDNIRVISARANRIKSDATLDELEKIVDYIKNG